MKIPNDLKLLIGKEFSIDFEHEGKKYLMWVKCSSVEKRKNGYESPKDIFIPVNSNEEKQ